MTLDTGLSVVAVSFLRAPDAVVTARLDELAHEPASPAETCLTTARGEEICYTVCNKTEGRLISGLGGFFMGLISSGLGELNGYFLLQRCRVPSSVSVATTVFVVAITALAASAGHLVQIAQDGGTGLLRTAHLLAFTLPGVVVGAQLAPLLADWMPDRALKLGVGCVFVGTALLLVIGRGVIS